jgi:peptide/nickel transport system permease protein
MRNLRRFFSRWQNWLGLFIVLFFIFIALAAPRLSPMDPEKPGTTKTVGYIRDFVPHPPSAEAPFGTLPKQLSVYHSVVWGARTALIFGVTVTAFAMLIGILVGACSAYFGGFVRGLLMRITDTFLAFPLIAGVILISQLFTLLLTQAGVVWMRQNFGLNPLSVSPLAMVIPEDLPFWLVTFQKIDPVILAFILFSWMPYARVTNTMVMRLMKTEYVEAARVIGARNGRIIFRHILPNAISPVIVLGARDVGGMVLLQATFTFIGLGGDSPWGMLLATGRDWVISPGGGIFTYWWVFLPATLALILFGIGWNLLGDGLNDVLNPREV